MFKNWFSRSTGERLRSKSRPRSANQPKPPTSSHPRNSSVAAPQRVSNNPGHDPRRNTTATATASKSTNKKPHASVVVGNIEVVTPRATVVVPRDRANVSGANIVASQSPTRHRASPKTTSPIEVTSGRHSDREGTRESRHYPKHPQSSRSDRLPTHVANTDHRSSSYPHRRASYSGYGNDHDYAVSTSRAHTPAFQIVKANQFPRRGSYPLSYLPATYVQEPTPAYPEIIYQPLYTQPQPLQPHPHLLYPIPAPAPRARRRSLSNADSISSYYSDRSNTMPNTFTVPRGWYNRRGDQYVRKGVIIMQPPERQWHPVFASYPDVGKGWMDENENLLAQGGGILKGGTGISLPADIHVN